jgi:hypothetical protein
MLLAAEGRRNWLEILRLFRRFGRSQESSIENSIRELGREIELIRIFSGYDLTGEVREVS